MARHFARLVATFSRFGLNRKVIPGGASSANELLRGPAVLDKLGSEMIQQFGMAGRFAGKTVVIHRADQARSEQVMPDAIDPHTGSEWVVRIGQPLSQLNPATAAARERGLVFRSDLDGEASRNKFAELMGVPPDVDVAAFGFGPVHHGQRQRASPVMFEVFQYGNTGGVFFGSGCRGIPLFLQVGPGRLVASRLGLPVRCFRTRLRDASDLFLEFVSFAIGLVTPAGFLRQFRFIGTNAFCASQQIVSRFRQRSLVDRAEDPVHAAIQRHRAAEQPRQCVVVSVRDGIELVIVAPCTFKRHPQEGLANAVDLTVHNIHPQLDFVASHQFPGTNCQKAGRDDVFRCGFRTEGNSRADGT